MAAIISQMAANKRARQANRQSVISSDKCVYTIPPFDPCFDPLVHNKYMKAMHQRRMLESKSEMMIRIHLEKQREAQRLEGMRHMSRTHGLIGFNNTSDSQSANVLTDLLSGCAILILGLGLILLLVFYIWIMLWNVDDPNVALRTSGTEEAKHNNLSSFLSS